MKEFGRDSDSGDSSLPTLKLYPGCIAGKSGRKVMVKSVQLARLA